MRHKQQKGVTLVELVLSIVIISVSLSGILSVMNLTIGHSADPMIQHQAVAIAESYLEEILVQSFNDPDGTEVGETRATFDDVDDYNGLSDAGARDQNGAVVSGLENYQVNVAVSSVTLTAGIPAKKAIVTVTWGGSFTITLAGYRT